MRRNPALQPRGRPRPRYGLTARRRPPHRAGAGHPESKTSAEWPVSGRPSMAVQCGWGEAEVRLRHDVIATEKILP